MKRILCVALICLLTLSLVPTFAESKYAEHMDFTATFQEYGTIQGHDGIYDYFCEMFNMDINMQPISAAALKEKSSIMINGGTMTDWMMTNLSYAEYVAYSEAGMFKPLPEGWETRWPHLYKMVQKSGIAEKICLDGVTYSLPKAIFCNYVDGVALGHDSFYYRKDWAEELGFNFGDTVTISDAMAYCKAAVENDMAGNGQTVGFTGAVLNALMFMYNTSYKTFARTEDGYVWGAAMDSTLDGLKYMREQYLSGAIDKDYYLRQRADYLNLFSAGLAVALFSSGTVGDYELLLTDAAAAGIENPKDKLAIAVLVNDDGVWCGNEASNYSWEAVFNPNLSDEKMERILDFMDYSATEEGQLVINMGLKDIDWKYDENGDFEMITEGDLVSKYSSLYFWWFSSILGDEFSLISPARDSFAQERVNKMYAIRSASNSYTPIDYDFKYFSGEAKDNFSVNVTDEMNRLIVEDDLTDEQLEEQWNYFIKVNEGLWKPVVEEVNEALIG